MFNSNFFPFVPVEEILAKLSKKKKYRRAPEVEFNLSFSSKR